MEGMIYSMARVFLHHSISGGVAWRKFDIGRASIEIERKGCELIVEGMIGKAKKLLEEVG